MKKIYILLCLAAIPFAGMYAQIAGTWKIAAQPAALAVGPTLGDFSWWSNTAADLTTRDCYFDDDYVFDSNGSFSNVQGGSTWLEAWQGVAQDQCGTPVAPHDGSNSATWAYDSMAGTLTLTGVGAYLGLPKVINGAEINDPANAPASITYPVVISNDTMTIDIDFGGGYWHFVLAKSTTTEIEDVAQDHFSFFPNPATSEVRISSSKQIAELKICDLTGKTMVKLEKPSLNEVIDVSSFPKGIYLMESRSNNQRTVKKLLVN